MAGLAVKVDKVTYINNDDQEDYSFSFQVTKDDRVSTPMVNANEMKLNVQELQEIFEKNKKETSKNLTSRTRLLNVIGSRMKLATSFLHFERMLAKQDISVHYNTNESGRIYGVTFVDNKHKTVFKGSELGKQFSANVFEQLKSTWTTGERTLNMQRVRKNDREYKKKHSKFSIKRESIKRNVKLSKTQGSNDFYKELEAEKERKSNIQLTINN